MSRAPLQTLIYPTRRAVVLTALGAPVALILAAVAPGLWAVALGWIGVIIGLIGIDALSAPTVRSATLELDTPPELAALSPPRPAVLRVVFAGRAPSTVEAMLEADALLTVHPARQYAPVDAGRAHLVFALSPVRRGEAKIDRAWARWRGPLGLVHLQAAADVARVVPVTPNVHGVHEEAMRLLARDAAFGQKAQVDLGQGSEFQALREFQDGMDLRAIDWRQSARHGQLLSREFRTERNHPIMLCLDGGRLMGEPVGGAPKLDRALNAALLLAYVGLRTGDRVGLAAFDSRPRLMGKPAAGIAAFPLIQQLAARIDYSTQETNFTLGLSTLSGALDRRALVVVFTDFADTTSAELMLESTARLTKRHLVLFVLFEDEELESLVRREPLEADDVSRAVVAQALLREREVVVARLRRLGVEVVVAPAERVGPALIDRYLQLKRQDRL